MDVSNLDQPDYIYNKEPEARAAEILLEDSWKPTGAPRWAADTPFTQPRRQPDTVENFGTGRYSTWNYPDGTREVRYVADVNDQNSSCRLTRYNAAGRVECKFELSRPSLSPVHSSYRETTLTVTRSDGSVRTTYLATGFTGGVVGRETFRNSNGVTSVNTISYDDANKQMQEYRHIIMR